METIEELNPALSWRNRVILMAEDDDDDYCLTRDAFQEAGVSVELRRVRDGEELMDYLRRRGEYRNLNGSSFPVLVLLDLNMPKKDGREALKEIREDPKLKGIPIVILTTSKASEDVLYSYDLGVNSFIRKPSSFEGLVGVVKAFKKYWIETVKVPRELG
jgi:CheY-like chemotaxis protein